MQPPDPDARAVSPTNPEDLKLDISLVSNQRRKSLKSPQRHSPQRQPFDVVGDEVERLLRSSGVKAIKIDDAVALALYVAHYIRAKIPGEKWFKDRENSCVAVTHRMLRQDLITNKDVSLSAEQLSAITSFLTHLVRPCVHSTLMERLFARPGNAARTRSTAGEDGSAKSPVEMIPRPKSRLPEEQAKILDKMKASKQRRRNVNPHNSQREEEKRKQRYLRRTMSLEEAGLSPRAGGTSSLYHRPPPNAAGGDMFNGSFTAGASNTFDAKTGPKEAGPLDPSKPKAPGHASESLNKHLAHNPYVGMIRHAPDATEVDISDKVYQMALAQPWAPTDEKAYTAALIPLTARVLQLVEFESGSGRYGEVYEEEVAMQVLNRFVEVGITWASDEEKERARELMHSAVPEAITSRLTLSTIDAIVSMSEKQVLRRKLEQGIPFMAVMGLDTRLKCEAECVEFSKKARKVDNQILTIDLLFSTMGALVLEFLVGYNTAVMNSPRDVIFPGSNTDFLWSLAVSVFAIGGPFGALFGGMFANTCGRQKALLFNMALFFAGGVTLTLAPDMTWIIIARLGIGFASGFATVLVPVYIGELAPPALRGTFGTMSQLSMVTGILFASAISIWCTSTQGWRYLFGVTPFIAVASFYSILQAKESPRWLFSHGTMPEPQMRLQVGKLLMELRGFRDETEVAAELDIFADAIRRQKTQHKSAHALGAMAELLFDNRLRPLMICTLVLQMAQQFCGINAVFYYSTTFLKGAVADPLVGSLIISAVNVIATYLAAKVMDKYPRKGLLLFSAIGMFVACIGVTFALEHSLGVYKALRSPLALVSTGLYVTMFELGLGPIPWLISSEMFDVKNVATAQSIASQVNWLCNFAVGLGFPFMADALGGLTFIPFAAVLLLTALFVVTYVPETAGQTSEQVFESVLNPVQRKERELERKSASFDGTYTPIRGMSRAHSRSINMRRVPGSYGSFGDLQTGSYNDLRKRSSRMVTPARTSSANMKCTPGSSQLRRKESFQDLFYHNK